MAFDCEKYYDMWNKHGVKLSSRIEITQKILDLVNGQNEVCDLIWAINAANQSDKSYANLRNTVVDQIRKLSPLLLNHQGRFKEKHSAAEVEERAVRHFTTDPVGSFIKRQPKIRNVLEGYINKSPSEKNNNQSITDTLPQAEIPTWDEIQDIYRKNAKLGEWIDPGRLKELIENLFRKQERKLRPNWWEETKNIIRKESEKNNAR